MTDPTNDDDRSKYRPKNLAGGRPALFPNEDTLTRTITLPRETWDYLYSSFDSLSRGVYEAVNAYRDEIAE